VAEVAVNGQTYQVNIENDAEVAAGKGLNKRDPFRKCDF